MNKKIYLINWLVIFLLEFITFMVSVNFMSDLKAITVSMLIGSLALATGFKLDKYL